MQSLIGSSGAAPNTLKTAAAQGVDQSGGTLVPSSSVFQLVCSAQIVIGPSGILVALAYYAQFTGAAAHGCKPQLQDSTNNFTLLPHAASDPGGITACIQDFASIFQPFNLNGIETGLTPGQKVTVQFNLKNFDGSSGVGYTQANLLLMTW